MAKVRVELLGGVAATTAAGGALDVGPPKCRAVLAALALSPGEAVSVWRLVDLVWGEQSPGTAPKIVQGYVSRLRKSLGADAIVRVGGAYRLDPAAVDVDVTRFHERVSAGDVDGALATWTGVPLAGLDAPGLSPVVDGLVEQWLGVVERDLAARTDTDPASTVGPLTELTSAHPFREGLWALLMTALYRTGRQADALAAYQRAREHLVQQLGVEPGGRLRELETRILAADEQLAATPQATDRAVGRPTGTVTFGFADVADADRLWVDHRRKMAAAVARLDTVAGQVTTRHGGTVITSPGGTIGAAFHRAQDAVAWARELQAVADQEPWPGGIDVRLQVGLHTGEAEEHDGGYLGAPVQTAARLAAAANAGQTLAAAVTVAVLERDVRSLGHHRLDGVAGQHELYQLDSGRHPPLRTATTRQGNLPRRLVELVGRDDDIAAVRAEIETTPLVTLVGPGGIGKTSLAVAVARRWHDDVAGRVWFVELGEVQTAGEVVHVVAETLGVGEAGHGDLRTSIVTAVSSRRTLVVLDNCEHVIDGAADLARAIIEGAPQTRLLATSREGLAVVGEQQHPVEPLDPDSAGVELFAQRARARSPSFDLDVDRPTVADICRRLDGLPLAIELAAARTRSLSLEQLRDRLEDRLRLLSAQRPATQRHQTLRASVQWSYDLLSRGQRRLFERLSVFVGPFDLDAAESVATDAELDAVEVDQLLGDLVERSMVTIDSGPFGRRFRLLETLRQFAAAQLDAGGERRAVEQRYGDWCRDQVARTGALLTGHGEVAGVARLAELWPNLRAAVDRAGTDRDRALADALVRPIATEVNLRRRAEIGDWAERILALTPPDDEPNVVFWLFWAADRYMQAGDHDAYERLVERHGHADHPLTRVTRAYLYEDSEDLAAWSPAAVAWLREQGEDHAAALTELTGVSSGLMTTGRLAELDRLASALADRFRIHGPPTLRYFALGILGYSARFQRRQEDADRFFAEAAGVDVPAGTFAASAPAEARALFERGDRSRGLRILRDHVDDLIDADYTDVARLAAVEFVAMMAAIDRLTDAARILAYLDTTGDFGMLARDALIADAARRIAVELDAGDDGPALDAREALAYMRDALETVATDTPRPGDLCIPPGSSPNP